MRSRKYVHGGSLKKNLDMLTTLLFYELAYGFLFVYGRQFLFVIVIVL